MARIANLEMTVDCMIESPVYQPAIDVGFNGQSFRKQIFSDLLAAFRFEVIVETGTWTGNTTAYMAQTSGLPVHSCELSARFHALAKVRLKEVGGVHLHRNDSRSFLRELADSPVRDRCCLFYLDAHWHADLPLREEIQIVASAWSHFVIMIDDFEVPGDPDYRFDDYGGAKVLSLKVFDKVFESQQLAAFFPRRPGTLETGAKSGCVVVVRDGTDAARLEQVPSLVRAP